MSHRANVWVLLPLFFVLIIDAMGIGIIMPVVGPLFMDKAHGMLPADTSQYIRNVCYGLTLVIFFVFMFVGAPFLGDLSDKYGRKKIIIGCLLITGISYLLCALGIKWDSVALLLFGRGLAGFMAGSQPIAQAAIIDISPPQDKAKNLGTITMASCLGFVIGPLLGGLFSYNNFNFSWLDYSTAFYIAGILALINGVSVWFTFQETHQTQTKASVHILKGLSLFMEAFRDSNIRIVSAGFLLLQLAWGLYFQFISIFFIATYHYTSMEIGLFMAYIGVIFSITLTLLIRLFLRFTEIHQLAIGSLVLTGISILVNILYPAQWFIWVMVIPIIIAIGLGYTAIITLYSNQVPPDKQGWVMGVSTSIIAVAWIIGGLITALISAWLIAAPFIIATIASLIGAAILYGYRKHYEAASKPATD